MFAILQSHIACLFEYNFSLKKAIYNLPNNTSLSVAIEDIYAQKE
jgi:hypothetical protein